MTAVLDWKIMITGIRMGNAKWSVMCTTTLCFLLASLFILLPSFLGSLDRSR